MSKDYEPGDGLAPPSKDGVHTPEVTDLLDAGPKRPAEIVLKLEPPSDKNEREAFSIRNIIHAVLSNIRLVIIIFLIFGLVSTALAFFYNDQVRTRQAFAAALVTFGFPEAEEGLDPLGNALNIHAMQSPFVIGNALDVTGFRELGVTAEGVRSNLVINAVVSHDFIERIELIRESATRNPTRLIELEEEFYHPTQFVLRLHQQGGLNALTNAEVAQLLNEIIQQYTLYFMDAYSDFRFLDVIVGHFDQTAYDFFEVVEILTGTVDNMLSYVDSKRELAPEYRAPSTQMTFGDIYANLDLLRTVDIRRVSALVHVNNMSRNRLRSADIIQYRIMRLTMERDVAQANARDELYLITEIYEPEVWVLDHMPEYYRFFRYREIYEEIMYSAWDHLHRVNALNVEITYLQGVMNSLRRSTPVASPEDVRFVEEALPALFAALESWEHIINLTVNDFLTLNLFRDAVRLTSPAVFHNSYSVHLNQMILIIVIGSLIGLLAAFLTAIFRSSIFESKQRDAIIAKEIRFYEKGRNGHGKNGKNGHGKNGDSDKEYALYEEYKNGGEKK